MKPKRLVFLLHMPIKAVRLLTDPVVDGILWFIRPALSHLYRIFTEVWKLRASETAKSRVNLDTLYSHTLRRLQQFTPTIFRFASSAPPSTPTSPASIRKSLLAVMARWPFGFVTYKHIEIPVTSSTEPSILRSWLTSFGSGWRHLAVEDGPKEQVFAIWIGYVAIVGGALLFLSSGVMFNGATRIVRNIITQQLIVLKVRATTWRRALADAASQSTGCFLYPDRANGLPVGLWRSLGHLHLTCVP